MPVFLLKFQCDMIGLDSLSFKGPQIEVSYTCSCGFEKKNAFIDREDPQESENHRSETHMAEKCKGCGKQNTAFVLDEKTISGSYTSADVELKDMLAVDCRGMEITNWNLGEGWSAQNSHSTFPEIDLSANEYFDVCDQEGEVSITSCKTAVERSHNKHIKKSRK